MSANDYTVADYIEANYFTSSSASIEASADLVVNLSVSVEGEITPVAGISGGNDYVEVGYIDDTYFTQDLVGGGGGIQDTGGAFNAFFPTINTDVEKIANAECLTNVQCDLTAQPNVLRDVDAAFVSLTTSTAIGGTTKDITLTAFDDAELTASGGKLLTGSVIQPGENSYVDGQYIDGNYFVAGIGVVPGITSTLAAIIGKIHQGTTNNVSQANDYIDGDYIESGYFEGGGILTTIVPAFSLSAELTLDETGPINGSATLTATFTLTAEALELTAPQEAFSSMFAATAIVAVPNITYGIDANATSSFDSSANATKAYGFASDISADFASQTDAQRARGVEAAFVEQISITTINSRIRDTAIQIDSNFQVAAFAQRGRGIDLYAFTNGQLTADINAIRDSNTLANTFFDIGTDFIRQRDNSSEADAETSTTTLPIRIRDTSLETQDAFSFTPVAVKTCDIQKDIVDTFVLPDVQYSVTKETPAVIENNFTFDVVIDIFRGFESNQETAVAVDLIPNVTREMSSDIYYAATIVGSGNATLDCDMVAFDDAETTALANARYRANSEMFSIPGFNLVANNTRLRLQISNTQTAFTSTSTATRIRGLVTDPAQAESTISVLATKIHPGASAMSENFALNAAGVVKFYFFPTDFSVAVADEPLADTFFSRTRETGVNI